MQTEVDCGPGRNPWDAARAYRQHLIEQLESDEVFQRWRSLGQIAAKIPNPLLGWLMRLMLRPALKVTYDLSITNLGRISIPDTYGPLRIEAIVPPSLSPNLNEHRVLAVGMYGGQISMTLTTRDQVVARQIRDHGMRYLRQALA